MYGPGYPSPEGGYPPQGYPQQAGAYPCLPQLPQRYLPPGPHPYPQEAYPQQPGYGGPPSYYLIVSRLNNLVLDIQGGNTNPGAVVSTWHRQNSDNQLWYDDQATGTIRSKLNGLCLDIEGDGALRVMPPQMGDPNQQWQRDPQQGYIRNRMNRNRVIDILNLNREPGAKIGAWEANNGPNQLWNFEYAGGPGPGPAAGMAFPHPHPGGAFPQAGHYPLPGCPQQAMNRRKFFIVSEMHGKVLDVKGASIDPGASLIVWSRNSPPAKNQLWYSDQQGIIRSALSDFAIDAQPGQDAVQQPYNGGPNQQWVFEGHLIKNRATGEALDIARAKQKDGTKVCSWKVHDEKNQRWRLEYI